MEGIVIRSILVPIDGCQIAGGARTVAQQLARSAGTRLRFLTGREPALVAPPAYRLGADPVGGAQPALFEAEAVSASMIVEAVAADPPDLVVMFCRRPEPMGDDYFESVALPVVRQVSAPVLLLQARGDREVAAPALQVRRLLLLTDFSPASEAIVPSAIALARTTQAHVTLLHVVDPEHGRAGPLDAQKRLDRRADGLRASGVSAAARVLVATNPAVAILGCLSGDRYDLLAMAASGAGGSEQTAIGRVAEQVLRGAKKPVLISSGLARRLNPSDLTSFLRGLP